METTYTYSIENDFEQGLYTYQLRLEISNSSIATPIAYIVTNDDVVNIVFTDELSSEDQATLASLVTNHAPQQNKEIMIDYYPAVINTANTNFVKLGRFQHEGIINVGNINGIDIVSNMDAGATSYTVKIVCRNDNMTVCEKTFNNITTGVNVFTSEDILYQPLKPSLFEVWCKVTNPTSSKKYAYIEEIKVWQ